MFYKEKHNHYKCFSPSSANMWLSVIVVVQLQATVKNMHTQRDIVGPHHLLFLNSWTSTCMQCWQQTDSVMHWSDICQCIMFEKKPLCVAVRLQPWIQATKGKNDAWDWLLYCCHEKNKKHSDVFSLLNGAFQYVHIEGFHLFCPVCIPTYFPT